MILLSEKYNTPYYVQGWSTVFSSSGRRHTLHDSRRRRLFHKIYWVDHCKIPSVVPTWSVPLICRLAIGYWLIDDALRIERTYIFCACGGRDRLRNNGIRKTWSLRNSGVCNRRLKKRCVTLAIVYSYYRQSLPLGRTRVSNTGEPTKAQQRIPTTENGSFAVTELRDLT